MTTKTIPMTDRGRQISLQIEADHIQKISEDKWEATDNAFVQVAIRYGDRVVSFPCKKVRVEKRLEIVMIYAYREANSSTIGIGLFHSSGKFMPREVTAILERMIHPNSVTIR